MNSNLPIGVFDSGVGGLTVARAIIAELPAESVFYFGDMARCPYGDRTPTEVTDFAIQICDFLVSQGVKMLVVACNTATAVALPSLAIRYPIPVIGVIDPGARAAVAVAPGRHVGVIGTAVTIASGAYEQAVRRLQPEAEVVSLACPPLVPLVESGLVSGPYAKSVVQSTLEPLLSADMDTLILGCTHYPLLQPIIQEVVGNDVTIISSAAETAREVKRVLAHRGWFAEGPGPGTRRYYTTGDGIRMTGAVLDWVGETFTGPDVRSVHLPVLEVPNSSS